MLICLCHLFGYVSFSYVFFFGEKKDVTIFSITSSFVLSDLASC